MGTFYTWNVNVTVTYTDYNLNSLASEKLKFLVIYCSIQIVQYGIDRRLLSTISLSENQT
jgi:hypothetical protein